MPSALEEQLKQVALDEFKDSIAKGKQDQVFRTGDSEIDGFLMDSKVAPRITHSQPDKVTIYSTQDGTPSTILVYMLAKQMKKTLPDGRKAFVLRQSEAPARINMGLKCYLHADSEKRSEVIEVGLGAFDCKKSNLPSLFEQERHMKTTHTNAWAVLTAARERKDKDEERDLLRAQVKAMQALGGTVVQPEASASSPAMPSRPIFPCPHCTRFFDSNQGLSLHKSNQHPIGAAAQLVEAT